MRTRHLVDPELLAALDAWPAGSVTMAELAARRAALPGMIVPRASYARADVTIERRLVPGAAGAPDVPVFLYRPTQMTGPLPVYLHMHGGGYVFGCAEMLGPVHVRLAAELGCVVASVDYRLAPETRAPGSLEDCYAALGWLQAQAGALGIDAGRIAVGGESAGGGLAAALALLARDRGDHALCFQLLIYPMLDDRTVTDAEPDPHTGEYVWTHAQNAFGWESLLGHAPGIAGVSPYCAAARAADLRGLPPAYVDVGALDLFREEDVAYAMRLLRAGVPTELHVHPGAYHGFERSARARVVQAAERGRRAALARAFGA